MQVYLAPNRPSGFARTIGCPGSRRMIAKAPEGQSSRFAEEGSAAHDLVSKCLTSNTIPVEHYGGEIVRDEVWPINEDMVRATSVMVGWCRTLMYHPKNTYTAIERKLKIPGLDMPEGGTGDFIAIVGETCHVVDYKHGKGVFVDPEGNSQFLSYARGAMHTVIGFHKVRKVVLTCIQPRFYGQEAVRKWTIKVEDLIAWGENIAEPAVVVSRKPDAPLVPGDWCQFCPAAGFCTAPLQAAMDGMYVIKEPANEW